MTDVNTISSFRDLAREIFSIRSWGQDLRRAAKLFNRNLVPYAFGEARLMREADKIEPPPGQRSIVHETLVINAQTEQILKRTLKTHLLFLPKAVLGFLAIDTFCVFACLWGPQPSTAVNGTAGAIMLALNYAALRTGVFSSGLAGQTVEQLDQLYGVRPEIIPPARSCRSSSRRHFM